MDKYDLVLDLVEHPERYSDAQISELLSDAECKEIYTLLCKTSASVRIKNGSRCPDIDEEWKKVTSGYRRVWRFNFLRPGSRAASIAVLSLTSLAAVALGVAVAVKESGAHSTAAGEDQTAATGYADAAASYSNDTIIALQDKDLLAEAVLYKDEQLGKILDAIAKSYNVTVEYRNKETAGLHLYYKFNPAMPLTEVIDQLNTFERINIQINGNTLIVD